MTDTLDLDPPSPDPMSYAAGLTAIWPDTEHLLSGKAVDELAALAEANDRAGRLDDRSIEVLRDADYFGLPVPTELEGGGASVLECCAIQRRIGAADPALAVAVNMHLFSVGVIVEHWLRAKDEAWMLLEAIATQRRVVASAFAEPGLGGSILRSTCTAVRQGKDWLVNGIKVPCSLAERSDLLCLQLQDVAGGKDSLLAALLVTHSPGVEVIRTWDTLGMRASESDTVKLTDVVLPDDLVFHRSTPGFDGDVVFAAGLGWFCVTATAVYLGVISAAVDEARRALAKSRLAHLNAARAELPSFQSLLGDVVSAVLPMEVACAGLARALDDRDNDPRSLLPAMLALKSEAAGVTGRAVEAAAELVGVRSYGSSGSASRLWRDAQAARYHPPTRVATRQILGRWALGLPFGFELAEQPYREAGGDDG